MTWLRVVSMVVVVTALATDGTASGFKLVAHPAVPATSLTRAAVASAFLKKTEKWPDGTPVVPVDQGRESSLRQEFCKQIHDKSQSMVDAYWQKQVFSGRATPPATRASDAEVIAFVRSTHGAIGYVSAGADTAGLKEIRVE